MNAKDPFQINEFKSEGTFISFLKSSGDIFDFFNCGFSLAGDLGHLLTKSQIPGIEALGPDEPLLPSTGWVFPGLFISNVRFTKPVNFQMCKFPGPVVFHNVTFEKGFSFFDVDFETDVTLSAVKFLGLTQFRSVRVKGGFSIMKCLIHTGPIGFRDGNYERGLSIYETTVEGELDLAGTVCKEILLIRQSILKGKLNLTNCTLERLQLIGNDKKGEALLVSDLLLADSVIKGQVQIDKLKVTGDFIAERTEVNGGVYITNSRFCGKWFWGNSFFEQGVGIQKTVFEQHLSFSYARFSKWVSISRSDYQRAEIFFTGAKFGGDLVLGANITGHKRETFEGKITFRGAIIEANSIARIFGLNTAKKPSGELNFDSALVKGLIDIREVYLDTISFDGTVVSGSIQDNLSVLGAIKDRNTARVLKHESRKINNHLAALRYYRAEMAIYSKSLKWYKSDCWLMFLNRCSNNYGLSWTRGVVFTIGLGLFFYSLYTLQKTGYDLLHLLNERFAAGFINYFWLPTGFNELVDPVNPVHMNGGAFGALFFILGKIAIAYGIYQTIAAFRKHIQ